MRAIQIESVRQLYNEIDNVSDRHHPEEIARGFDYIQRLVEEIGEGYVILHTDYPSPKTAKPFMNMAMRGMFNRKKLMTFQMLFDYACHKLSDGPLLDDETKIQKVVAEGIFSLRLMRGFDPEDPKSKFVDKLKKATQTALTRLATLLVAELSDRTPFMEEDARAAASARIVACRATAADLVLPLFDLTGMNLVLPTAKALRAHYAITDGPTRSEAEKHRHLELARLKFRLLEGAGEDEYHLNHGEFIKHDEDIRYHLKFAGRSERDLDPERFGNDRDAVEAILVLERQSYAVSCKESMAYLYGSPGQANVFKITLQAQIDNFRHLALEDPRNPTDRDKKTLAMLKQVENRLQGRSPLGLRRPPSPNCEKPETL